MDYEGNYFPEEKKERSKTSKAFRTTMRVILFSAVAVVYVATLAVILTNCEPKTYKEYVFTPAANELYEANPEDFEVYEVFPTTFMNYDGSVQIAGVAYSSTAKELELGIKYNNKLNGEDGDKKPQFVLVDTNGKKYAAVCNLSESKGRYCYMRISFCDVELLLDENVYINPEASAEVEGEGEMFETFKYVLEIHVEGEEKPETVLIYDNVTPIQLTVFEK